MAAGGGGVAGGLGGGAGGGLQHHVRVDRQIFDNHLLDCKDSA